MPATKDTRDRQQYCLDNKDRIAARHRRYYLANKEHLNKLSRQYYATNRDAVIKQVNQYAVINKDKISAKQKVYYQLHKSEIAEKRVKYYQKNSAKIKQYISQYRKNNRAKINKVQRDYTKHKLRADPLFKATRAIRSLIGNSISDYGYTKKSKTAVILGCSFNEFKAHFDKQFKPGMTWDNHGEWHIDHKIPLCSAKTEEELIKLNHYTNLQPLWADENLIKGAKLELT